MTATTEALDANIRAAVLVEALPYIQKFAGRTVVVKFGGNAMVDASLADSFAADVVLLRAISFLYSCHASGLGLGVV